MSPLILSTLMLLQAASTSPAPAPAAEPTPIQLRFDTADARMTVPVQVAGAGPFRFVIDTGAQRTVVSRELAATLGLPAGRTVRLTAMTETSQVGTVVVPSIAVSPFGAQAVEAPALAAADMGAPGILGIDTLQGHAVRIDFDRGAMAVTPATRRDRRRAAPDEIVVRARSMFGQLVVTDATYRGTRVRVILDTGSAVTMGNEALRRRMSRRAPSRDIQLLSVTGGTMTAGYTQVDRVRIGDVTLGNLPVAFSAAAPFRAFGLLDKPAMLLGMDALRLFREVRIDFANREVRLRLPRGMARAGGDGLRSES